MSTRHLAPLALVALGLTLVGLLAMAGGCAHRREVPRQPADIPGYHKPPPDLTGEDVSALQGRRILVDPGHGGFFRGAVGDAGLTEAEVNLGVALYLQGLLQWAGAEVHLTRSTDRDFLSPADSSLTADLAARVAMCDSLMPDVFVSIHHNSTASRDPDVNETQTYHPLGRDGADRDLALCVHRQLVRALEISPAKILPGGFHVLRHAPVPAVLGEPAMLSNPVIEGRLNLARSLELEARAYFLGLRDYFAGGTPRWSTALPDTLPSGGDVALRWTFDPGPPGAPGLDPTTLEIRADGQHLVPRLSADGQTVELGRQQIRGRRQLTIVGRNLRARATPTRRHILAGDRDHPRVVAFVDPDDRSLLHIQRDEAEQATGHAMGRETTLVRLSDGWTWLLLHAPAELWPHHDVPGPGWRLRRPGLGGETGDAPGVDTVLRPEWPAIPVHQGEPLWVEADGALPLLLDAAGQTPAGDQSAPGPESLTWRPLLAPLVGRRVAIDPRGGGTDEQGRGPLGTRGSDLNLELAHRLAALLRGVGCEVLLVRDRDLHTPDPTKVQRASQFGAEYYLALGRGRPEVRHHPGSQVGEPWAGHLAAAVGAILTTPVAAITAYDYVLRHTACPAAVVMLESPAEATPDTEDRLRSPAWQDAMARSLLRGLVAQLAPATPWDDPATLVDALGERAIDRTRLDHVRLDGNLTWLPPSGQAPDQPLASWVAGDPGLPVAGVHHVLELHSGPHWQLWVLTRQPSGDWHGRVFLENR